MTKTLTTLVVLLTSSSITLGGTLVLKRAWIEQFKDRATIDVHFPVDHAHKHPNDPESDADMHGAGRAPTEVGLPMVAEMVNAFGATSATGKAAITAIHA